jgi:glycosyltransferase involved in cell wall biosynthesis
MRIGLVGGIFGREPALRRNVWYTPETILHEGLRRLGHDAVAMSHFMPFRMKEFDVVHVHHLSLGAVRAASGSSRTPFVFTVHSTNRNETWAREQALRFVFGRADAVVALSCGELRADAAVYNLHGAIQQVIYNGVDADMYRFASKPAHDTLRPWSILCVAHLTPMKDHETLLRATARLPFDVEVKLVYHGETLLVKLQRLAAELGIAHRVRFLGPKNPNELRELYQQADVFVLSSSFGEALPSVITEAMMCGTPVVATDVGGILEQVGDYPVVVPPNSADALAAAIRQVIENHAVWIARAEQISRRARDRFSIQTMIERHVELYRNVIERGACRRHSLAALAPNVAAGAVVRLVRLLNGNPHLRKAR